MNPVSLLPKIRFYFILKFWVLDSVVIWECNQKRSQKWRIATQVAGSGHFEVDGDTGSALTPTTIYIHLFISWFILIYLGLCLEAPYFAGAQTFTSRCNSHEEQEWFLFKAWYWWTEVMNWIDSSRMPVCSTGAGCFWPRWFIYPIISYPEFQFLNFMFARVLRDYTAQY